MRLGTQEAIDLGREVVKKGQLKALRKRLGITRNAMAELLNIAWPTYSAWEERPVTLRLDTAARLGRFYAFAVEELNLLTEAGVNVEELMPFHLVATLLAIPQEELLRRYRDGEFQAVDAGLLGLWIYKSELEHLKKS